MLQLSHPEKVDGLVLINGTASKATWTEWGYQKVAAVMTALIGLFVLFVFEQRNE